jgi:lipopolysaccharide export system permease protein
MGSFMLLLHGGVLLINLAWLGVRQNNWGRRSKQSSSAAVLPTPKIEPT